MTVTYNEIERNPQRLYSIQYLFKMPFMFIVFIVLYSLYSYTSYARWGV